MKIIIGILYILVLYFFNPLTSIAKNYEKNNFICADEVGPLLEFNLPFFEKNLKEKEFSVKLFSHKNRDSFTIEKGSIKKTNSPIDTSYYYYVVNLYSDATKRGKRYFELFPPSTLMIQNEGPQFESLVCWNP